MYDITNYQDLIKYIKSINNGRFKNSNGWHETYCPFCDDINRKNYLSHGHLYICSTSEFFVCHRCDEKGHITKFIKAIGYCGSDLNSIIKDTKTSFIITNKTRSIVYNKSHNFNENYIKFKTTSVKRYSIFLEYIKNRCNYINPIDYKLSPNIVNDKLVCDIYNANNVRLASRFIDNNTKRYLNHSEKQYYYFQDIYDIVNKQNIIICEGAFDIINLSNYWKFNTSNSFFISVGGSHYTSCISYLLHEWILIGKFNIFMIFDKDISKKTIYMKNIKKIIKYINISINIKFYQPVLSKDVSELFWLEEISC